MTAADEAKGGETTMTWTTWEELLLACAVKRHGLKDWDSVTMEIQTRTSSLCTPQICRDKYLELKRRFVDEPAAVDEAGMEEGEVEIPWIEELRKLRVAELTQEVQRYDLSIQSLQSKVKRLEDERERSQKDNQVTDGEKPDLETDSKTNRSENDKIDDADGTSPEVTPANSTGKETTGEHSNRSFNESNSSDNHEEKASAGGGMESEPVLTGDEDVKPDPDSKTIRENSCNDSSDTVARQLVASRRSKKEAADSKEGTTTTKESSDVQSSASLTKKERRKVASRGGGGVEEEPVAVSPATTASASVKKEGVVVVKSEPLVAVMDIIRAHKHGLVFGRRLESQKTEKYNKIIRQHVDLRIVQARIDDGSYSSCTNKFFLDLLLIFNNAIVFFPKSSPESIAAHALRNLVLNETRKKKPIDKKKPDPISEPESIPIRPEPELERSHSLLAKQKSAAPIVVCRKRSSISGKPSSANKVVEKETVVPKPLVIPKPPVKTSSNEEEGSMKMKEKPVTGARSMRRSGANTNRTINSSNANVGTNKNPLLSTSSNLENATSKGSDTLASPPPPKVEKKKAEVITTPIVKKRGAADFLKRIKKTSPGKGNVAENSKGSEEDGGGSRKGSGEDGGVSRKGSDQVKKKVVEERRDVVAARQRSGGGRQVKEDISPSKRGVGRPPKKGKEVVPAKRGRETVEPESKRPAKRTRR